MSDENPRVLNSGPACGKLTGTGVVNYPCILDAGHDGPCVVREIPATQIARRRWEASLELPATMSDQPSGEEPTPDPDLALGGEDARAAALEIAAEVDAITGDDIGIDDDPPPAPPAPQDGSMPLVLPEGWANSERALAASWETIRQLEFDALPQSFRVLLQEAVQRRALTVLWKESSALFRAGASTITITQDDLAALVPPHARDK